MEHVTEKYREIHIALYNNLYLLTVVKNNPKLYDGTHLQDHLRPDMFVNTNKFAFEHIIYFLINIIDPNLTKNLPWPLLDKTSESEFRSNVKRILNDINSKYEDARVPTVQTSHMITPGGIKIVKILFYLSELAIFQCLENDNDDEDDDEPTLLPFAASVNNFPRQLKHVDNIIQYKHKQISEMYNVYIERTNEIVKIAHTYSSQLLPFWEEIEKLKESSNGLIDDKFLEFAKEISKSLDELKQHEKLFEQNRDVIHEIVTNVNNRGFTFEKDMFNIRQNIIRKLLNNQNELNLMELLTLVDNALNDLILHLKQQPVFDLTQLDDLSIKIIQDYELFINNIQTKQNPELKELNNLLRDNIERYNTELLKKFNTDHSYLKKLTTPEFEFNIPIAYGQTTKVTATSLRKTSFFETLTTTKKCMKKANDMKISSNVKRNLMGNNISTPSNLSANNYNTLKVDTSSTSKVCSRPLNANSTPEVVISKPTSDGKHTRNIRQLLKNEPLIEVSTPNASLSISQDIFDVFNLNDELDCTEMFPNITKN